MEGRQRRSFIALITQVNMAAGARAVPMDFCDRPRQRFERLRSSRGARRRAAANARSQATSPSWTRSERLMAWTLCP